MRMKLAAVSLLALGASGAAVGDFANAAHASLRGTDGREVGEASVREAGNAIAVRLMARGLAPGRYGVHLHAVGSCDGPDFASAGAHWNPTGRQHGRLNPAGAHSGDLPNLEIGASGEGRLVFDIPIAAGANGHALHDADGASILIHAQPDDERSDPSGNSGARIACGVLIV